MVKMFSVFLLLIVAPLPGEEQGLAEDWTKVADRSRSCRQKGFAVRGEQLQRIPMIIRIPEPKSEFEQQMGILPAPDAKTVEPNGLIFEGDPTIDIKMIYPKAARDKIVQERRKKLQIPRRYRFK